MDTKIYKSREDQLMQPKARPMTPGQVAAGLLDELNLSQTELAQRIGVSRATVNEVINGRRSLTPDMAHRLGRFFGNGAAVWLRMQATVQMWDALHMDQSVYASIEPVQAEPEAIAT